MNNKLDVFFALNADELIMDQYLFTIVKRALHIAANDEYLTDETENADGYTAKIVMSRGQICIAIAYFRRSDDHQNLELRIEEDGLRVFSFDARYRCGRRGREEQTDGRVRYLIPGYWEAYLRQWFEDLP